MDDKENEELIKSMLEEEYAQEEEEREWLDWIRRCEELEDE